MEPNAARATMELADDGRPAATTSPTATRVTRIAVERAFDFAGPEYHELFGRSDATAFQHPLWLDRLYFHLAPVRGAEKLVVTGRTATGQLLFVLPMIRRRKWGITLVEAADLGVSDYVAPVVDLSWQPSDDLVRSVREQLPSFDLLRVRPVRAEAVNRWQVFSPHRPRSRILALTPSASSRRTPNGESKR